MVGSRLAAGCRLVAAAVTWQLRGCIVLAASPAESHTQHMFVLRDTTYELCIGKTRSYSALLVVLECRMLVSHVHTGVGHASVAAPIGAPSKCCGRLVATSVVWCLHTAVCSLVV